MSKYVHLVYNYYIPGKFKIFKTKKSADDYLTERFFQGEKNNYIKTCKIHD